MAKEFKLQDPGEGIHEAEVRELQVAAGDHVNDGDPLLSVETDKAINDITAPFTGTIKALKVEVGQQIKVGDVLLTYDSDDDAAAEDSADETSESKDSTAGEETSPASEKETEDRKEKQKAKEKDKKKVEEKREKKGEEKGEEKGQKKEKGEDKETQESGQEKAESGTSQEKSSPKSQPQESEGEEKAKSDDKEQESRETAGRPVPASPATRRRAREQGIDLHEVEGSGPGGRVTAEDLHAHAERGTAEAGEGKSAELPDFSRWGDIERKPLRSLRRATARQMSLSWSKIPHVMHRETADITELELFRRQHRQAIADQGGKLTLTVLVIKAVAAALREYPSFNTSLDEDNNEIIVRNYHHIGVAVATDEGLLVPVIRDVDRKSLGELAVELTALAERARQGDIEREEMQGASFTVTNPGPLGGDSFTPIINYPEAAILGVCSARLLPVVSGDMDNWEISPRLRLPLCLVFDHRLNDGAEAARFLHSIVAMLRDPQAYLLAV